jgi:hypothetical protein
MTVFKVENKDKRGSLKCKFILSAFLNAWTFDMNLFKKEEQRIPVEVMS